MKIFKWLVLGLGLFALPLLHAQGSRYAAPLDSVVQLTAEEQGLTLMDYSDLPRSGTFWLVCSNGLKIPMPCPPSDSATPVYEISDGVFLVDGTKGQVSVSRGQTPTDAVAEQANTVVDLISQVQENAWERMMVAVLGGEESTNLQNFTSLTSVDYNTNGLFLEITNIANGLVHLNLHNAKNAVYAIWSTSDLLTPWQVATELWPIDTNCQPFTLHMAGRQNLFLRAEDWTEADSDGDGLPDWWSWYWFGNLNASATNLDDLGNTFAYDFAMGLDPNVISFTLATPNLYVNQTVVPVQINLTAGIPAYYALLVNDTNQAHAVWHSFTGTNLLVTLGATDGDYDVSVGLKGWSPEAMETWDTDEITFTLDRIAPKINLTSAVNATVIKPYLQVQGWADKSLASLSYDITNAFGVATNESVVVTEVAGYDADSNGWRTNYFQAYDVPLATNGNFITLRVTDRAGNTTTTNFNVTLDYTTATNPPAVNLTWPQDGMVVSGTNITIRGTMSDETGSVVAQVVNGDGTTNLITGIVERNGNFWLENVPLNGTNAVTIQATDAAGNVTENNFTVKPSNLLLTIDSTPTGDALYQPCGTVTGTVGDPDAIVTVNGTNALVDGSSVNEDGSYNWTATDVPVYGQGTATFDVTADYGDAGGSGGSVQANTSGGSGGSGSAANVSKSLAMDSTVLITHYHFTETTLSGYVGGWLTQLTRTRDYDWQWQKNSSGQMQPGYQATDYYYEDEDGDIYTNLQSWVSPAVPTWDGLIARDTILFDAAGAGGSDYEAMFTYLAKKVHHHWNYGGSYADVTAGADTRWTLFTGGKGVIQKLILFAINATADNIKGSRTGPSEGGRFWDHAPIDPVTATDIQVLGQPLGTDGLLWTVLPKNTPVMLGVAINSKKHTSVNIWAPGYNPTVIANGVTLDPDTVTNGADFCVGQGIRFDVGNLPGISHWWWPGGIDNWTAKWTLPGNFVNIKSHPNCPRYYEKNLALLIKDWSVDNTVSTLCWYVQGETSATAKALVHIYPNNS